MSASSCVAFKLSKFRLLSLLSAWCSEINPPPVTTTLPSGACRMSYVAKKEGQVFFIFRQRKKTLRFSITLLIDCTDFYFFFRVPDFIDCTISIKNNINSSKSNAFSQHDSHIHVCMFTKCPQTLVFQTLNKKLAIYNQCSSIIKVC